MSDETTRQDDDVTLEQVVEKIQTLVSTIEQHGDPTIVSQVFELLDWVDVLHREGLERLVAGLTGAGFLDKALDDPVVAHLFAVYGLIDSADSQRAVLDALDEIRPYAQSHGGEMTLEGIDGGVVRVRLLGACDGCPSSIVTITQSLDRAIRQRWPGLIRIEVAEEDGDQVWSPVTVRTSK